MSGRLTKLFTDIVRRVSTKPTTNGEIKPKIFNRNPRNLEKLRIERKPTGYPVDEIFVEYWHKLKITSHKRYILAQLIHNSGKVVVEAGTYEWAIRKHLYSAKDRQAYIVLAHVFAERCLESGMTCFCAPVLSEGDTKIQMFRKILEDEGLILEEPTVYNVHAIWQTQKEKKPWTVLEDSN